MQCERMDAAQGLTDYAMKRCPERARWTVRDALGNVMQRLCTEHKERQRLHVGWTVRRN